LFGALTEFALDYPSDGDCLSVANLVTDAVTRLGRPARTVIVAGWMNKAQTIIGFLHHVTECTGVILDGTARQFSRDVPAVWILPTDRYLTELAGFTRVASATIWRYAT